MDWGYPAYRLDIEQNSPLKNNITTRSIPDPTDINEAVEGNDMRGNRRVCLK